MPHHRMDRASLIRIGNNLRQLRERYDLSQEDLAWPDCSPSTLSRIECGVQEPSAKLIDNLLGKLGEDTIPWGCLFCIDDIEKCALQLQLTEAIRYNVINGLNDLYLAYYTDKKNSKDPHRSTYDNIPDLIVLYEKAVTTIDERMLIEYLKNFYLIYPLLTPEEIIKIDLDLLAIRKENAPKEQLVHACFPTETEKLIISDIALRNMDLKNYENAEEIWQDLLIKQHSSRFISPVFWRRIAIYRYNLALCMYLSKNMNYARRHLISALDALLRGGEAALPLYFKALFVRILQYERDTDMFLRYFASLKLDCRLLRRYYSFAYSSHDLIHTKHGLPVI